MKSLLSFFLLIFSQWSFSQHDQRLCFVNRCTVSTEEYLITVNILPAENDVHPGEIRYNPQGDPAVKCRQSSFYCIIRDSLVYMGYQPEAIDKEPDAYLSNTEIRFIHTDFFGCKPDEQTVILNRIGVDTQGPETTGSAMDKQEETVLPDDESVIIFIANPTGKKLDESDQKEDFVVDFAEVEPTFPGGEDSLKQFIRQNLIYPKDAPCAQGSVYVQFVVREDGSLTNVEILKGVTPLFDQEAIRIVSIMPKWIPASQNGKPIAIRYQIPIRFQIQ